MDIIERQRDGVAMLTLRGNLHCGTAESDLKRMLDDLSKRGCVRCALNLNEVPHIDTTCIGVIIGAHVRFRRHGGAVCLVQTPPRIRYVLSIAKLDDVLVTFASEDEAVRAFGRSVDASIVPS